MQITCPVSFDGGVVGQEQRRIVKCQRLDEKEAKVTTDRSSGPGYIKPVAPILWVILLYGRPGEASKKKHQ